MSALATSAPLATRQPVRMCASCRERKPKAVLSRYTMAENGLQLDPTATSPGRGWYVCSEACLERLSSRARKSPQSMTAHSNKRKSS